MKCVRLTIFAILITMCAATPSYAIYENLPPSKTSVCAILLSNLLKIDVLGQASKSYALNALKSLRFIQLRAGDVRGATPAGVFTSESSSRSKRLAAERMKGIELFASRSEGEDPSQRNVMVAATFSGNDNISNFLSEVQSEVDLVRPHVNGTINLAQAFFWGASLLWISLRQTAYSMLISASFLLDTHIRLLFKVDLGFAKRVERLRSLAHAESGPSWIMISQNLKIRKSILDRVMANQPFADDLRKDVGVDALPTLSRMYGKLIDPKDFTFQEQNWVGIDMLLTRPKSGEPQLHVFMRLSKDRPVFPKTSKITVKEPLLEGLLGPIRQPAPVPIPIRVPERK